MYALGNIYRVSCYVTVDNEECLYGFPTTVIGEKEGGPKCQLPLCQGGGHVVAVFLLEGEVCIVREWGQLEVLSVEDCGWRVGGNDETYVHLYVVHYYWLSSCMLH